MDDKKRKKVENEEQSLDQLIKRLKENLLVEGTRKMDEDDIARVMRHWLNEDKKH